ncbi:hypothetical protein FGADI_10313 [Fusarium gaditjirri]|uniref:Uncharacterized protein n=1 Tax=Fusarium gaditjirri TaxID=282569 RepID=A0A8H4WRF8_9HYPO|nr:hypothetical protein FGADI_10313 [Fusarium gaditjirri]
MPHPAPTPKSPSHQSGAVKESNDRIHDWLLDPGLDIQGRLLTGGQLSVQPQLSTDVPTNPPPKAQI